VSLSPDEVYTNYTITALVSMADDGASSSGIVYTWYVDGDEVDGVTGLTLEGSRTASSSMGWMTDCNR
jgi:subtilase family serine protease